MEKKAISRTKAILHPVRARIIVSVGDRVMTPREIAQRMEEIPLGTVYRHINLLVDAGILRVVSERRVHGTVERQFALVEEASYVNREEVGPEEIVGLLAALTGILQDTFGRYMRQASLPLPEGAISLLVKSLYLTPDENQSLRQMILEYSRKSGRTSEEGMERRLIGFFSVPDIDPPTDTSDTPANSS